MIHFFLSFYIVQMTLRYMSQEIPASLYMLIRFTMVDNLWWSALSFFLYHFIKEKNTITKVKICFAFFSKLFFCVLSVSAAKISPPF